MKHIVLNITALLTLGLLTACNKSATGVSSGAAGIKGFEKWAKALFEEGEGDILLPDPELWFKEHFPADLAAKLAEDYAAGVRRNGVAGLADFIKKSKAEGKTELRVSGFDKAFDSNATGCQNAALQQMTKPVTLYTLRMCKPGDDLGSSLASFAEVGGKFRFIGKMLPLNPNPGDLASAILSVSPIHEMEVVLKEKELIPGTGEAYLKAKGMLK
jgi:hypothetical protein